ncbi:MAG: tRNA preQ1(34) S-adenosylmethionine ribosyltransferase-isomerase QueA [bacterium]
MSSYPIELLDYELPSELIAQEPLDDRSASRMLHVIRNSGEIIHRNFRDLPKLLRIGDVLVLNDSKVIPGRIRGRKLTGGSVEIVVLKEMDEYRFEVIAEVRGGLKKGDRYLLVNDFLIEVEWAEQGGPRGIIKATAYLPKCHDEEQFKLDDMHPAAELEEPLFLEMFYSGGEMPIPPYIKRQSEFPDRYQTVYALNRGSAAAPTAGLHFTQEVLDEIARRGVDIQRITLHIGIGTFLPIRSEDLAMHKMHKEEYRVSEEAAEAIIKAIREGRRIVAAGTTTVRTLEAVFSPCNCSVDGTPFKLKGETDLFIFPGYNFKVVGAMLTNFHLPKSTLLAMVYAFGGRNVIRNAYQSAISERYRFYSFGDCMLIE